MPLRRRATSRPALAVALGGAAAAVVLPDLLPPDLLLPGRLHADRRFPLVDAVAWRPHAAVTAVAGAALLATRRRTRPAAALVAAVGLGGIAAVAGRAIARPAPPAAGDEVTVLAVNVLTGRADTGELATLIEREQPDFVVLPEAGADYRDKLMPLVGALGHRSWVSTPPGTPDRASVALLAGERAGDVRVRAAGGMGVPHLEATGGILGGRTLHAVHTTAPTRPWLAAMWRRDLELIGRWCRGPVAPIVAGDLNATLDHSALRAALGGCRSAAAGTGHGLAGTYPASLPRPLGIQIDHVLVPAGAVTSRFEILDVAGTDHRAVLARVRLPAGRLPAR